MSKANVTDIVDRLRYSDIYDYADAVALCDEAAAEIERLRAAVEEIYKSSHQVHIIEIARAVLEGK